MAAANPAAPASAQTGVDLPETSQPIAEKAASSGTQVILPAFSPLKVMLDEELSSQTHGVGDKFTVTVLEDVVDRDTVVIPKGSIGHGKVTFATAKGGFGKPGIIAISLTKLELADREVELDGRYREEGRNKNGAVVATWLAVGVFSGFIKGKPGSIEKGRELVAKTGEPIEYRVGENAMLASTGGNSDDGTGTEDTTRLEAAEAGGDAGTVAETQSPGTGLPEDNQVTLDGEL